MKTFTKAFLACLIYATNVFAGSHQYNFIENKGQLPKNVLYSTSVESGKLYFERNCLTFDFSDYSSLHVHEAEVRSKNFSAQKTIKRHSYKVYFEGANSNAVLHAGTQSITKYNYFSGKDESKWATNVNSYKTVTYTNIYRNINISYYTSAAGNLKYDVLLLPGANAADIQLKYEGVNTIEIENGNLVINTSLNQITELKPVAYQVINGKRKYVTCNYTLKNNTLSFSFPNSYNKNLPLIIDPEVIFSTYSGSKADNFGFSGTYDKNGNAYSAGIVFSKGYPVTTGAIQDTFSGGNDNQELGIMPEDIGIMKFSADGKNLLYATYLGGTGNEEPHNIIVNSQNELLIVGTTTSFDFPISQKPFNKYNLGKGDIFISKISDDGSKLLASTYFGGYDADGYNGEYGFRNADLNMNYSDVYKTKIEVDEADNVIILSSTRSQDLPKKNAFQYNLYGKQDACLAKFKPDLDSLIFSTYFGGSEQEAGFGLAIGNDNTIYICGGTTSYNLYTSTNAYQTTYKGKIDGFVSSFDKDGKILNSTFLGTTEYDQAYLLYWKNDQLYVAGQSLGAFPVSANVYKNTGGTQYIATLKNDLSAINRSTVFGSGRTKLELCLSALSADNCGNIYVAGWGGNINFQFNSAASSINGLPLTADAWQRTTDGSDFYIAVFAHEFDTLLYATYYGGNYSEEHVDGGTSRFDENGVLYLTVCGGCGGYSDLPTTDSAWSKTNNGIRTGPSHLGGCNQAMLKYNLKPQHAFNFGYSVDNNTVKFYGPESQSYKWTFGDGTSSTDKNPKHNFAALKKYTVCLVAQTLCGPDTLCKEIDLLKTSVPETEFYNIKIYPNPAQNSLTINIADDDASKHFPAMLYMADALGRQVMQVKLTEANTNVNISQVSNGLYFYSIKSGTEILSNGKIIVSH